MDEGMKAEEAKERFGNLTNMCQRDGWTHWVFVGEPTTIRIPKLGTWAKDQSDPGDEQE